MNASNRRLPNDDGPDDGPWYRQPWPWILIALPASVVIACAITAWWIIKIPDHAVAFDPPQPVNMVLGHNSVVPPGE